MDLDWSAITVAQAEDRIHRLGITRPVQIYRLLTRGTIDELMQKSLNEQWNNQRIVREYITQERRAL